MLPFHASIANLNASCGFKNTADKLTEPRAWGKTYCFQRGLLIPMLGYRFELIVRNKYSLPRYMGSLLFCVGIMQVADILQRIQVVLL